MFQFPFRLGFEMFHDMPNTFRRSYTCYSVSMLPGNERDDVEKGGKIIMPPSALEQLTRLNINYPMLFGIRNPKSGRTTHCGVLEFIAEENKIFIPYWMMRNLGLEEGDIVDVESKALPVASFSKFQPLTSDFLEISNPKAVLENSLRNFACLSKGDLIAIKYNENVYELMVLETKPSDAVSIIECDMNVDFAPPMDYKETEKNQQPNEELDIMKIARSSSGFVAFSGGSGRLNGKKIDANEDNDAIRKSYKRGVPDYNYVPKTITFFRHLRPQCAEESSETNSFAPFTGTGETLRQGAKKARRARRAKKQEDLASSS